MCRYWRESIISAPENWTLVSLCSRNLAALTLERSKAAPLHLCVHRPWVADHEAMFCDLITPYVQNIETLGFWDLITIEDLIRVLPNFPQSTPNLRSLELYHEDDESQWDPSTDPFEFFPNALTSLTLYEIPLYPSFLKLRTLTKLSLHYYMIHVPPDYLLDFLEENRSLESVDLKIDFEEFPVHVPRRRVVTMDRLQRLSITFWEAETGRTLISNISLRRGAHLDITFYGQEMDLGLNDILSDITVTHLSNLSSPTFMRYRSSPREVQLIGPNGSFFYDRGLNTGPPFVEFSVLPLADIRELSLSYSHPSMVFHPSHFPALETLTVWRDTDVSLLLSALFPDPSFFPSLKSLKFTDCSLTEKFMEELTRFASDRKNTTSAWLHHVVITGKGGDLPTAASVRELERHVPVVDVRFGD